MLEDYDETVDYSCNQCQALMIQGCYCHEVGCPNIDKVKIDGQWVPQPLPDDEEEDEDE